jgi:hypothetical protein
MEKQIISPDSPPDSSDQPWLDLTACARVRLTSEAPGHPIESALRLDDADEDGWQAAQPGTQTIWLNFDRPQAIEQIHVRFEASKPRTQEFVLLASTDGGVSYRDIVRQQFNFSPDATRTEEENYFPRLTGITDLKLTITPDISGGDACATLQRLRLR